MIKKLFLIPLSLLLAISLIAIGCPAEETTTPTTTAPTTTTPTTTTPTTTEPEVIELIFNDHNPPASAPSQSLVTWAEYVKEQSEGRLEITIIPGAGLYTGEEVYRGVQTGGCDGGLYVIDVREGFKLNLIMPLPFMGWPEQHVEDAYWTLLDEFPEMVAEWEGVTILTCGLMGGTHIHNNKKEVRTPEDIEGMKVMSAEYMLAAPMELAGATPVQVDVMELAQSLQTGLIEGCFNHFAMIMIFGAAELLPYHTVFGGGGINMTPMYVVINTDVLNSLPPDLQQLLMDSSSVWYDNFCELDALTTLASLGMCEEMGHTFVNLTPEEIEVWYNLVKGPVHDTWIADCEAAGLPGQAVYDRALELARE